MGLLLEDKEHRYIKYGMYGLNFLIVLLGIALMAVGIWIRIDFDVLEYQKSLVPIFDLCVDAPGVEKFKINVHIDTIAYFLIFLGTAIIGMGGVGTVGAMGERQSMLGCFCILLFIIFAILLTSGVHSVSYKDTFMSCEGFVTDRLRANVKDYYNNVSSQVFMDLLQEKLSCCGADVGRADYNITNGTDLFEPCSLGNFETSCDEVVKDFFSAISDNMIMIVVVSFSISIFTIVGMGMSAFLFTALRTGSAKLWTQEMNEGKQSSKRRV